MGQILPSHTYAALLPVVQLYTSNEGQDFVLDVFVFCYTSQKLVFLPCSDI